MRNIKVLVRIIESVYRLAVFYFFESAVRIVNHTFEHIAVFPLANIPLSGSKEILTVAVEFTT